MITIKRNPKTNTVKFFQNGKQVFPTYVSGNIAEFENGEMVLF